MSIVDADVPQVGTGLWRGPGDENEGPPSEHAPMRPFDADDTAGQFLALKESIDNLGRLLASQKEDAPTGNASGNTDASGNLALPVYAVAAGEIFSVHRLIVEVQGSTPAAPSSAGWYGFYELDSIPQSFPAGLADQLQGALVDFAPSTNGGATFPAIFADGNKQAAKIRGPKTLVLIVFGGPATKRISVNYQGTLRRERGIV